MKKKAFIIGITASAILVIVLMFAIVKYFAPSNVKRSMEQQYKELGKDQAIVAVDGELLKIQALVQGKEFYVPMDAARTYFNKRFFFDDKEEILTYTMPSEIIQVKVGVKEYKKGIQNETANAPIIIRVNNQLYISLEFINKYSKVECKTYTNPNRLVAYTQFDESLELLALSESGRLRVGPNKKYDYLLDLKEKTQVFPVKDAKEENEYVKVMTQEGIEGYLPKELVTESVKTKMQTQKVTPIFPQIAMDQKICLAWHQVTNYDTNKYFDTTMSMTQGINVVSPTWFALSDNKGNFTSIASDEYVAKAHNSGMKVWALINDFNTKVNLSRLLTKTSNRERLINNIVAKALQLKIDGINIDFERVKKSSSAAYLEFLRELTLKCHSNQLVVSVDNYKPAAHNTHYDLEEQGKIVDYVVIMGYDEHYAGSANAGSVSSLGFVKDGLTKAVKQAGKDRVVMALPFYTRLWKKTSKGKLSSQVYGMNGAETMLKQNGAMAKWDEKTGQYVAKFKSGKTKYSIWLEEEKSLEEKMKISMDADIAGLAFWKLGFERSSVWSVIEKYTK